MQLSPAAVRGVSNRLIAQFIDEQFEQLKPFAERPPQTGVVDYEPLNCLFREAVERHAAKFREMG